MVLDPRTSGLVAIDLRNGVLGRDARPRPASEVVVSARPLAARSRAAAG